MKRCALLLFLIPGLLPAAHAQPKLDSLVGAIAEVDKTGHTLTLKTDAGESVKLTTDAATTCVRIPAGERTLSKAEPIKFDDISIADRVLAHGTKTSSGFM